MRYAQHFGLEGPLFQMVAPSQPPYMSEAHREGLAALEWGLCHEPSPFTLLIGEPGAGKTTLLRFLLAHHYDQIRTVLVTDPAAHFDDLLRQILRHFGIGAGSTKQQMLEAFDAFLATVEPGGRVVIAIDEAQALSDTTLEELRLLSNRETPEPNQLHFLLVGQRELARRLLEPGLVQLNDRIGARAALDRMSRAEAFAYLEYCLRVGGGSARRVFGRRALAHIVDHSGSLPRRLNVLCHNAMRETYAAGRRKVNLGAARRATAQYECAFAGQTPVTRRTGGRATSILARFARTFGPLHVDHDVARP